MTKQSRGFQGVVLKALGAEDFELTVLGRREITEHYLRLSFRAGGLLADRSLHPTMWIRMWFPAGGNKLHQRGYTLIDPDPVADTVDIEFAMHDGSAANWARKAQPGDTITANVMGSNFALPEPAPLGYLLVGDTAALPAVNSLLSSIGDRPARVWLEWVHAEDRDLPVIAHPNCEITWVQRENAGGGLVAAVKQAAFDATGHFGFVACEAKTTRAVTGVLRSDYRVDRKFIKSQAYWMA